MNHGTYGGYQMCRRRDEGACEPCKRACAVYAEKFRTANPDSVRRGARGENAKRRAHRRLAALHPSEFRRLLNEELRKQETT